MNMFTMLYRKHRNEQQNSYYFIQAFETATVVAHKWSLLFLRQHSRYKKQHRHQHYWTSLGRKYSVIPQQSWSCTLKLHIFKGDTVCQMIMNWKNCHWLVKRIARRITMKGTTNLYHVVKYIEKVRVHFSSIFIVTKRVIFLHSNRAVLAFKTYTQPYIT